MKNDFNNLGEIINEESIINSTKQAFKTQIKKKTRIAAFAYLKQKQNMHSKVKNIRYTALETQQYISSPIFSDMYPYYLH